MPVETLPMSITGRKPDFSRLLTALRDREETDYVPTFEFHIADSVMSEFMGRLVRDPGRCGITLCPPPVDDALGWVAGFAEFYYRAGYDFVPIKFGVGPEVLRRLHAGAFPGYEKSHRANDRVWGEESEGFLVSAEDIRNFPWPTIDKPELSVLIEAGRHLADGVKVIACAGGMMAHARNYMGMETFWCGIAANDEAPFLLLDKLQTLQFAASDMATDLPHVGAYLIDDDLGHNTGLLESPTFLREHVFPFYKRLADMAHSKGLAVFMHSCGRIESVIPDIIECGVDALHPIQPGALDIVEIKRKFGDRIGLMGNLDMAGPLATGTPEETREAVRELVQSVAPGGGYALGSANSITDYVPFANYLAMLEAVTDFGRYPIVTTLPEED